MGFGIRVPGVRISTSGVRVGPRFANVGVSTRGRVSGSVGPRIARVSASPGGVRIGTGFGPGRVSVGRGGVRIGAGIGPVFGSVGRGGVRAGVGAGPVWGSTRLGGRSANRSVSSSPREKMNLSLEYQNYKDDLLSSGSSRRTRDELRIASINALLAALDYLIAPFENFYSPRPFEFDPKALDQWAENLAIKTLIDAERLTKRPDNMPEIPTLESTKLSVAAQLVESGLRRPIHPGKLFGLSTEDTPTEDELLIWALATTRASSTMAKRLFSAKSIRKEALEMVRQKRMELPSLIAQWETERQKFDNKIDEEVQKEQVRLMKQREALVESLTPIWELIYETKSEIQLMQKASIEMIEEAHRLFAEGDPAVTTLVLQTVMSDNAGSAAPIGIDNGDLLVVMTAPAMNEVIWPEKTEIKTSMTVRKKSKAEMITDYTMYLLSHTVATALEAFAASPKVNQVRVLVLDEEENTNFFERRLVGALDINRNTYATIPKDWLSSPVATTAIGVTNRWQEALATGNPDYILQVADWFEAGSISTITGFTLEILEMLSSPSDRFVTHLHKPKSKRPKLIDLTEATVNTSDSIQIIVSEESGIMKSLDLPIELLGSPDFWIFCLLLGQQWDLEEVDIEKIKIEASELASVLYPCEESSITRRPGF